MKAAVVHQYGAPLVLEDVPMPTPGPGEIIVKIETSGLCHTDLHAAHGDWPVKPPLPFIPGHEGVGVVTQLGAGVTAVREGERVAVPWLGYACGACAHCASGWETLCEQQVNTGYSANGGHAEYVRAHARYVGRVPAGVDAFDASPLTCAGVTTYKAVKVSGARSSDLVAVFGVGGLGHLAVQYAAIAGATVAAVDVADDKLDLVRKLSATFGFNARETDPAEEIKKLGGADAVICTAVSRPAFEQAYRSLRRGGTLVLVGIPADNLMPLPIFETIVNGVRVVGSIVGNRVDLAETFELHAAGRTRILSEARRLEQVNEAFAELEEGHVNGRIVFDLRG